MGLQNIFEGTIGSLTATVISTLFVFLVGKIWGKKVIMSGTHNKKFNILKINPFAIALFITSFFTIISGFSFYYQWTNMPYLITITFLLWIGSKWVYETQCPKCKKIFVRETHPPDILKEEKVPVRHQKSTIIRYSDGSFKERKYHGKGKIVMERVRTQKNNYSCKSCLNQWKGNSYKEYLDKHSRPKPNVKKTKIQNPNEYEFY